MSRALIIIDLIEDIIGKHGLSNSSYQQTQLRDVVNKTNGAISAARKNNIPVVWIKVGFADDYQDIPAGSPMFHHAKQIGALKLSGEGCNWVQALSVQPQDLELIKKGVSIFTGNELNTWLIKNQVTQLYLAGVSSLMAIQSSARQAHDLGYFVNVLEDLCAAATLELHEQSMQALSGMAVISSSTEFMQIQ